MLVVRFHGNSRQKQFVAFVIPVDASRSHNLQPVHGIRSLRKLSNYATSVERPHTLLVERPARAVAASRAGTVNAQ